MFGSSNRRTIIAKGLRIVGSVTAEGLVEVSGQVDGELHCTSLIISRGAQVSGIINAELVVVDGSVDGPIQGHDVLLKSRAHVVGDIQHQSLSIEKGAYFDGRSMQIGDINRLSKEPGEMPQSQPSKNRESLSSRIERAQMIEDD
jgi:cytoskeletal protein CcmA (bactofilin family)